jgi:glycosyltransferase involved in cell wall biosynthesis
MQYVPELERAGFKVEVASLFDNHYLNARYSGRRTKIPILRSLARRLLALRRSRQFDLIWLEKEALPWLPAFVEQALMSSKIRVAVDYDDAIFHRYDQNRHATIRWLLGNKIDRVMSASILVTAGNEYLAKRAREAGAQEVVIVPTVVDLDAYQVISPMTKHTSSLVGWIGTPQTWRELAQPIHAILEPVLRTHGAAFRAIGAALQRQSGDHLEFLPWAEASEAADIQALDIGVMPLPDTPWTRGKCGYKLIQYMACGLPVVASPVGVNAEIVEHGVNGFLASSDEEWRSAIGTLLQDPELRQRMGAAGRHKVENAYSLQIWGPKLAQLMRSVSDEGMTARARLKN